MDWKNLLEDISHKLISGSDLLDKFKDSKSNWLGYDPASNQDILTAEKRLGAKLPDSYKDFLRISNGFKQISSFNWDLMSVDKIDWIRNFDKEFTNLYAKQFKDINPIDDEKYFNYNEGQRSVDFRSEYLIECLALSDWGDSSILLLNPKVKFGNEWEAWMFANWMPGARRYRSFGELIRSEYKSYLNLLDEIDKHLTTQK